MCEETHVCFCAHGPCAWCMRAGGGCGADVADAGQQAAVSLWGAQVAGLRHHALQRAVREAGRPRWPETPVWGVHGQGQDQGAHRWVLLGAPVL